MLAQAAYGQEKAFDSLMPGNRHVRSMARGDQFAWSQGMDGHSKGFGRRPLGSRHNILGKIMK